MQSETYTLAQQKAEDCVQEILNSNSIVEGWEHFSNKNDVQASRMKIDKQYLIRGIGDIDVSAPSLVDYLWDITRKQEWEQFLTEASELHSFDDNLKLFYHQFWAPWPVSNRDFVFVAGKKMIDEQMMVISGKSIDVPEHPPRRGIVRAEIQASGFIIEPLTTRSTRLTYLVHVDPKGSLPNWLVNAMNKKQSQNVNRIRKAITGN